METNQNESEIKYVILTQKILGDKKLSMADRLILARISGFSQFYESPEATAEFLGVSVSTVRKSKQKLAKMNYIVEIGNTGRGKIYAPNLLQLPCRLAKNDNQIGKKCQSDWQNLPTENKERIKENKKGAQERAGHVEKEFGRAEINELVDLWEQETHISIKGNQHERRQLYNLIRKYGCEGVKMLIRRVGVTICSHDRFAPQIAVPSDLTGKYSKLPRMELWENRNKTSRPFGNGAQITPAPPMAMANKGMPDYNGAWDEQSDEERAKVTQMMRQAREKMRK